MIFALTYLLIAAIQSQLNNHMMPYPNQHLNPFFANGGGQQIYDHFHNQAQSGALVPNCNAAICNFNCENDCSNMILTCGPRTKHCNLFCYNQRCKGTQLFTQAKHTFVDCMEEDSCTDMFTVTTGPQPRVAGPMGLFAAQQQHGHYGYANQGQGQGQGNFGQNNFNQNNFNQFGVSPGPLNNFAGFYNDPNFNKNNPNATMKTLKVQSGMKSLSDSIINCVGSIEHCWVSGVQNFGSGMSIKDTILKCQQTVRNAKCIIDCGQMGVIGNHLEYPSCQGLRLQCGFMSQCSCCGSACIVGFAPMAAPLAPCNRMVGPNMP